MGILLGPYRLERELGSGGMGKVYAATVEKTTAGLPSGTRVALKVVHPHLLESEGFFKRFLNEAEIGKAVRHPNVVRTYDADALRHEGEESHFLVMEYVEGQTLRSLLEELESVPEELCRHIGREVAKGLAAIHAAGAVHRDLKPENVLITPDHQVKVMDLGVARLREEAVRLSRTGAFAGSLLYAAPEQFAGEGREPDPRGDLHALGLVLYELAAGFHPYRADEAPQVLRKVLHEEPRRLGDVNPQLSPFYEEVVHALLQKEPSKRPKSATEVQRILEEGEKSPWWAERSRQIRAVTKRPLRRIRIPRETALYGRDDELKRLRVLYEKAKSGEGQVLLLEGEAGIGKSRLVDEFVGGLQRDGEDLNFLFGSYPPGGAATASGAFSTAYREQFGDGSCAQWLQQTPLLVPAFDALLRGEPPPEGKEPLTKDSLHTCFVHATRNLAAERPTVVLVDDLHFASEDARSLFTMVALAVPGHRVLLVGTTRPGLPEAFTAQLTRLEHTTHQSLGRLGPKDLARLLVDAFHSERLAEELGHRIALKSDGNPFFVFEIIRGLREGQFISRRDDGTWVTTRVIEDIQIPASVRDLINARVADLDDAERNLLDVAACWGYEFDPSLAGAVLGMARVPTLQSFGRIEKRHRLVRSSGRRFSFDHHQVQEALYGALNEQLRDEYHAGLAGALEAQFGAAQTEPKDLDGSLCVDLAEHFLKGAQGPRALRYLDAALTHLKKGYLNDQAIRLAERALAVPGLLVGKERVEVLLKKAGRLDLLGRREAQAAALEEACSLAEATQDAGLRAKARCARSGYLMRVSRLVEAESVAREALDLARSAGDRKVEADATGILGGVFHHIGRYAEAQVQDERLLALAREIGDRWWEAGAAGNLGVVLSALGRYAEARAQHERCLALARERGDKDTEAGATINLGNVFCYLGRFAEARAQHERGLALAQQCGNRHWEAGATGNLGNVFATLGRYAEAQAQFEQYLALSREIGHREGVAIALVNLGPIGLAVGNRVRARQALEGSLSLCRVIGARSPEGYALVGLGSLADEEDDVAEALRFTEESLSLLRKFGKAHGVADSLLQLGDLRRRKGDAEGARRALEESVALSHEQGLKPQVVLGRALLAVLPGGDAKAAEAALAEAGEAGNTAKVRFLLWQATRNRAHLAEAKRLLDFLVEHAPPECRETMIANVRIHREIAAAAREAGL